MSTTSTPAVRLGRDLEWAPYEPWVPGVTTRVTGVMRSGSRLGDRGTAVTVSCAHEHPGLDELAAATAWADGAVHVLTARTGLMPVVLVPAAALTPAEVTAALDRALRDDLLRQERGAVR